MKKERLQSSPLIFIIVALTFLLGAASATMGEPNDVTQRLLEMEKRLLELEKQGAPGVVKQTASTASKRREPLVHAEVDFLNWILRGTKNQYGISDIGGVQDRGPVGSVLKVNTKDDNGLRLGITGRPWGRDKNAPKLTFRYTKFDTEANASHFGSLRATFVSSDNSENNDSDDNVNDITPDDRATSARALYHYYYRAYDLTIGQTVAQSKHFALGLYGGGRYVDMDHSFRVTYTGGDFQVPFSPFENCSVNGSGLLMGADLDWNILYGLNANFGLRGGMVLGDVETQTYIPDDEPGVPTNVRYSDSRAIPYIEMAASLTYTQRLGHVLLNASVGYEMINWFNVMDSRTFSDSHIEGQNIHQTGDISLDGLFLRVGIGF